VYQFQCLFIQIEVIKIEVHLNEECLYFTCNHKNNRLRVYLTIEPSIQQTEIAWKFVYSLAGYKLGIIIVTKYRRKKIYI